MKKLLSLAAAGFAARWLLDGAEGARRRAMVLGRVAGARRELGRGVDGLRDSAEGVRDAVTPRGGGSDDPARLAGNPDDTTLAHKVESEIFRPEGVPKGNINVNVEFGKVVLRGEVESQEMIDDLVARTREIDGVNGVESLLHLPGEPAPMHE
jgi:osmotically-inducible protein OsmY